MSRRRHRRADLDKHLDEKTLAEKQGAKERSVYNFTVARFGLLRFKKLVDTIFGAEDFADIFKELDDNIYVRMTDLLPSTQAEWAKVLDSFANMSYSVDGDSNLAINEGHQYALGSVGGVEVVEIALMDSYLRYRAYMKSTGSRPLYSGVQSFTHSIKDSPALMNYGHGELLQRPGIFRFNLAELAKLKVSPFK